MGNLDSQSGSRLQCLCCSQNENQIVLDQIQEVDRPKQSNFFTS